MERRCVLGNNITIGYFDQHSAEIQSEKSVAEHFHDLFPSMTEKEVRNILGMYLFPGKLASRRVSDLSGGEKAAAGAGGAVAEPAKLSGAGRAHQSIWMCRRRRHWSRHFRLIKGTILFVSHDRYFIRQVARVC